MITIRDRIIDILKECEVEEKDIFNDNYIENNILESLQIAEIVMQFEEQFEIEMDGEDIIPDNFMNLGQMEQLVMKYANKRGETKKNTVTQNEILWDMVARNTNNPIEQSGWKSSFTGQFFSEQEMREFAENVWLKLSPYLNKDCKVVEIGVGSGIIADRVAPYVKEYVGIDISSETLKKTKEWFQRKNISNVKLIQGSALRLQEVEIGSADIFIINSVIQYFEHYEEYVATIKNAISFIENGIIFVGDILDVDKRDTFLAELECKKGNANKKDLWYSKKDIARLQNDISEIKEVCITEKEGYTIQNELTKYRFDVIYKIRS